jgi:lipopolysaccharide export system permease protein
MFGNILHRMIFGELVRVFLLSLISLTGLFLLCGVVTEAAQRGLSPTQVLIIIPLLIPNTLPYTVPATCLFATCVVYGRLSHDNEITAVKAAGVHLGRLIAPALLLGALATVGVMAMSYEVIPDTHRTLRTQVLGDVDDLLYAQIKKQGCLKYRNMPYSIWVRQVQGRRLVDAIFKKRDPKSDGYNAVARAREARMHFDPAIGKIRVDMSYVTTWNDNDGDGSAVEPSTEIELPKALVGGDYVLRANDMTWPELLQQRENAAAEAVAADDAAQNPLPAHLPPEKKAEIAGFYKSTATSKKRNLATLDAEMHMRPALAVGCICFVLIGAPVGIWFSRADYLSAFVSCFLPTIAVYYPLLLCGTNMARDGRWPPALGLWMANAVVGTIALGLFARLLRR